MLLPRAIETDDPDSESSSWATFIGIIICICGNIIISFALNIQRLAHERIQRKLVASKDARLQPSAQETLSYGSGQSTSTVKDGNPEDEVGTLYLRSRLWWTGLVLVAIGEAGNFIAYGFAPASIVAPLGTVAILCNALIAPLVFHETFRLRDFTGVVLSTAGAVIIVLSAETKEEKLSPEDIWEAITDTPFLIYFTVCCAVAIVLVYLSRQVGEKSILIDLGLVAIFGIPVSQLKLIQGGFTALSTKGVSSLLSMSLYLIFTFPISYLLLFVLASTAILQVKYLNNALARFSSTQVIPTQFVMFTISVVLGSSILYKDFNSATPQRILKFVFGCLSTFIGVYLITSKRHISKSPHHQHHQQSPQQGQIEETAPLLVVTDPGSAPEAMLEETPPHLLGTSFGYHFTNPRILEKKASRSTLPRGTTGKRREDYLASAIWTRWTNHSEDEGGESMGRTQSERPVSAGGDVGGIDSERDRGCQSDVADERGSWGRNRGYSAV